MHVDYLIVGQGICGTMLSWFLMKEGKTFIVIDEAKENTASRVAAGIINPVTGRRYVYSWMIDTVMPFAKSTYLAMGEFLDAKLIQQKNIIDFFPSEQMLNAFVNRVAEDDTYLHPYPDQNHFNQYFNHDFGCGEIRPAFMVDVNNTLTAWRSHLLSNGFLLPEIFSLDRLTVSEDGVRYENYSAEKIIFCDGIASMINPWFQLLPFSANKGEVLLIESADLTNTHIFKKGLMLAPLSLENLFWVGSSYQWSFEDDSPSQQFYNTAKAHLDKWLKVPYTIIQHKAAVRPATLERRPFVGLHPSLSSVGILNGMGTKGTSLAPFFANQLVQHLVYDLPIMDEASLSRFSRILSK